MTKREIVFMCCRLMAVWLLMNSLFLLSQTFSSGLFGGMSVGSSTTASSISIYSNGTRATPLQLALFFVERLAPTLLNWVAALGFWFGAREVTVRMFENAPEAIESGPILSAGTEVRAVAFGCMGLFFLAQDIPDLLLWIIRFIWPLVVWTQPRPFFGFRYSGFAWEWVIRIPLSLWLVFGLRGLAGLWRIAQEKGVAPTTRSRLASEEEG